MAIVCQERFWYRSSSIYKILVEICVSVHKELKRTANVMNILHYLNGMAVTLNLWINGPSQVTSRGTPGKKRKCRPNGTSGKKRLK